MQDIVVKTELDLNEDQKSRVVNMVYMNMAVDHLGHFVDRHGSRHVLAAVHFTGKAADSVPGSDTTIDGIDNIRFDRTIHVILESDQGILVGLRHAKGAIASQWHYGIVLRDAEGQGWFHGRNEVTHEEIGPNEPILMRISLETVIPPGGGPVLLDGDFPVEGEFHLSQEDPPRIVSAPWFSGFAGEPDPRRTPEGIEAQLRERDILDEVLKKISGLRANAEADLRIG